MEYIPGIAFALLLVLTAVFFRRSRRRAVEREAWRSSPIPAFWLRILRRRLPILGRLPPTVRRRLFRHIKVFLAEKHFTACGGIRNVSDTMAVTIAGHACLLLAGRVGSLCFPTVQSVLVYPDYFYSPVSRFSGGGAVIVGNEARVGEASPMGNVVVSWREVLQSNAFAENGHNVVLHEFAHHIRPAGAALTAALDAGFRRLRANPNDPALDSYGATHREEFWAVSVEAFFENSVKLREEHPELYAAMSDFFALSPADW
ncbi:MAG: zinc-dependent peptidase [Puniceicoccales bacterium]|jgi:Mlc titration factor MtfA (ptsG expression regulator)|nr:zinc-dependent peptidase [Puniceicoccales bacterium]